LLIDLDYWVEEVRSRQKALENLMSNHRPEITDVSNLGTTLWHKIGDLLRVTENTLHETASLRKENIEHD